MKQYNKNPISLREGKVYIDGVEVMDSVKCEIKFKPDVWQGKQLGERSDSRRWLGFDITGVITRRRSNNFIKNVIKKYKTSGATPQFTIQGVMNDRGSDYYAKYGSDIVTVVGCVLTGEMPLTMLDSAGDVLDDVIRFGAKDIV